MRFGPEGDEVIEKWRKLHNEKLHYLYTLPNIVEVIKSRRMRWTGHVAHKGEDTDLHMIFMGNPERKRPRGRTGRTWEESIKTDV
jgi:hypothetical protein